MNKPSTIDTGLLIIRIGYGIAFLLHGYPKLAGGPVLWAKLGASMGLLGIHFAPVFWGFMASISEFLGACCLILGIAVRPASAFMLFTMIVATVLLTSNGQGFVQVSHPVEAGVVFLALLVAGPGAYSLCRRCRKCREQ